jgi:methyl-accepting chemotaxis protein
MKTLADQSKKAAQRIRDIVAEVQRGTADAVRTVETAASACRKRSSRWGR